MSSRTLNSVSHISARCSMRLSAWRPLTRSFRARQLVGKLFHQNILLWTIILQYRTVAHPVIQNKFQRVQEQNKFNCYVTIVKMVPMVTLTAVVTKITVANVIKVSTEIIKRIRNYSMKTESSKNNSILVHLLKPHTKPIVIIIRHSLIILM